MNILTFPRSHKFAALAATVMTVTVPINASAATILVNSFVGFSQRDSIALGVNGIPPDVGGAVGTTQFAQLQNNGFSVFDKNTGALLGPRLTDGQFFINAGGTDTFSDPRIIFDPTARRWVASVIGLTSNVIQIAVSDTDDALGRFRAATFQVLGAGGIADYPTLSLAGDSLVIGTANFNPNFIGTTLTAISRNDLYAAGGPSLANIRQFTASLGNDRGQNIQAVNRAPDGSGDFDVVSASSTVNDLLTYSVTAAGVQTPVVFLNSQYDSNSPARQPDLLNTGSQRVISTLDDRIGGSVFQAAGKIYSVHTVTPTGQDHTVARITIQDAVTKRVLSETDITGPDDTYDFYNPSLAVNESGQFVVGYVRSGDASHPIDGRISIFARSFNTNANGTVTSTSGDLLIKQSPVDDYHNGSAQGQPAAGRQRFGDYSQVSLDPTNSQRFYVINQFADFFNNAAGGNPTGTGASRYGTFIGIIGIDAIGGGGGVPEPATWAMMIMGFGFVGNAARRRRTRVNVTFA